MATSRRRKILFAALVPLALVLVVVGWWQARYWWNYSFSIGNRTGVLRKISVKGSPLCKYLAGELALTGTPGQPQEIWQFTTVDHSTDDPIVKQLHDAEAASEVELDYRQHLGNKGKLWVCDGQPEYYITGVHVIRK